MVVSQSIHIAAPVEQVFALLCDPARRAVLNPNATPLLVETDDHQPLHTGSTCHFRLQIGERVVDYRLHIRAVIPLVRIEAVSDTAITFETIMETSAEAGGTRLTQTESFEPSDDMLIEAAPPVPASRRFSKLIARLLPFLDSDSAEDLRARQEAILKESLEWKLGTWLEVIRQELENSSISNQASPDPASRHA